MGYVMVLTGWFAVVLTFWHNRIQQRKDRLMRLVKRAAITVKSKKPYITWANSLDEDWVRIGEDFTPEGCVYLIGDVADVIPLDRDVIVQPYFKAIFEEELNSWHRREGEWPSSRTYETFLEWFEVEVHSMVLDLQGSRMIRTESYY
jgi:hypothetical protein